METTELRIGNYVESEHFGGGTIEVIILGRFIECVDIKTKDSDNPIEHMGSVKPIPLDEQWLTKFGIELDIKNGVYWINSTVCILRDNHDTSHWGVFCDCSEGFISINNDGLDEVHELQNLYYALTGNELTIDGKA